MYRFIDIYTNECINPLDPTTGQLLMDKKVESDFKSEVYDWMDYNDFDADDFLNFSDEEQEEVDKVFDSNVDIPPPPPLPPAAEANNQVLVEVEVHVAKDVAEHMNQADPPTPLAAPLTTPPVQVPMVEASSDGYCSGGDQDKQTLCESSDKKNDNINDALQVLEDMAMQKKNIFDKFGVPVLSPQCVQPTKSADDDHDDAGSETDSLAESELVLPESESESVPLSPVAVNVEKAEEDNDVIIVDEYGPWKKRRIISTLNTAIEALQTVVEIVKDLKE